MSDVDRVLDAYLRVFAVRGWAGASLAAVAAESGLTAAAVLELVGDQWRAIDRIADRADRLALAAGSADPEAPARERLFDLAMARFDAARPWRDSGRRLLEDARMRPALTVTLLALAGRTSARLLSAAGIATTGIGGIARVKGLTLILADVGRVFMDDEDADLGATMRALDERLARAETLVNRLCPGRIDRQLDPAAAV